MEAELIRRELATLLDASGAAWTWSGGCVCFCLSREGAVWQMACRCLDGRMLAYGRWPGPVAERGAACRLCSELNAQLLQGALFLSAEGELVCRTEARLPDLYAARDRIREAIEYNAAVLCRFGQRFAPGRPTL